MSRERLSLLQHHLRGEIQRRPAHMHRPRPAMAIAARELPRLRLDETEPIDRQSEQSGGKVRKAGFVALAVRLCPKHKRNKPVRLEADRRALARGTA